MKDYEHDRVYEDYFPLEVEEGLEFNDKNMENSKWEFVFSTRFWALVIGSASTVLVTSFGAEPWYVSLGKFFGLVSAGFISIGTVDKFSKKSSTTTVTMPSNVSSVTASTDKVGTV